MKQSIETYTFSRALHMMRYGGKKMSQFCNNKVDEYVFFIKNGVIFVDTGAYHHNGEEVRVVRDLDYLTNDELMGEWVEVK